MTPHDLSKLSGLVPGTDVSQETSVLWAPELLASSNISPTYDEFGSDPLFAPPSSATEIDATAGQDMSLNWESLFSNDVFGTLDASVGMIEPPALDSQKTAMPDLPLSAAPATAPVSLDHQSTTTMITTTATTPVPDSGAPQSASSGSSRASSPSASSPLSPSSPPLSAQAPEGQAPCLTPATAPMIPQAPSSEPKSSSQVGRKRGRVSQLSPLEYDENDAAAKKRAKNTMAARKSRARRFEQAEQSAQRIRELEQEVEYWKGVAHNRLGIV